MQPYDPAKAYEIKAYEKNKKKCILFMYSKKYAEDVVVKTVESAIAETLSEFTIIRSHTPYESLQILLLKSIEILVIDCSLFDNVKITIEFAMEAKNKKKIPIFFITPTPSLLVQEYRKNMFNYEEMDDYFSIPIDQNEVKRRLKRVNSGDGRAAKRFSTKCQIKLYRLKDNSVIDAELNDVSLVGFGFTVGENVTFERGEQVQVSIPINQFKIFHPEYGEVIRLAGKVRRISINSIRIGCSIEFLTPMQNDVLTRIISNLHVATSEKRK